MHRLARLALVLLALGGGASRVTGAAPPGEPVPPAPPAPTAPRPENRLAGERSPYLRQHRTNPVDWWPWGPEALARAAREGKPIFLSIGYAACHWCHVMEHESFEDEATAALLNEAFVCMKVDREERPDLDRTYMAAVQMLTGRGGWPMTVFLTPDGRPFHGGTYYPRPHLQELVRRVREAWDTRREAVEQQASMLAGRVRESAAGLQLPPAGGSDREIVLRLAAALARAFDPRHGGYGGRPKFPPHSELRFLVEQGDRESLSMARRTLEALDEGGIHDQAGGGWHRYSTDATWLVPHFEKMLYDNALLVQACAAFHAATGEARFARAARRALAWMVRELKRPGGGFASSLDADTQGHEGLTYTWTPAQVEAVLPAAEAAFACAALDITPAGNYAEEATGEATGTSIPRLARPLAETAHALGLEPAAFHARLDPLLERLRVARDARPQPGLDDKVIASWNGLLLSALAGAGRALGEPRWLDEGRALAAHLLERHRGADGRLLRFPRESGPAIPGFAEDLVHVATGLLDLAEATGEARWREAALVQAGDLLERFEDREAGGLWATAQGTHEALIARGKEAWDSPIPSDNGAGAHLLLRLGHATGEARWRTAADRILAAYRPLLAHEQASRGVVALGRALALRLALDGAAAPQGDVQRQQGVLRVAGWMEQAEAAPGARVRWALRVEVEDGWHVNGTTAVAGQQAARLELAAPAPVTLGPVQWPAAGPSAAAPAAAAPAAARGAQPEGWAGSFWLRGEVQVPAGAPSGPQRVALRLCLQACDATSCRPPEVLELPFALGISAARRLPGKDGRMAGRRAGRVAAHPTQEAPWQARRSRSRRGCWPSRRSRRAWAT
ncbi:MAG: DUF255 domain-containing protein [Planctomycetia bacterium]